MDDVGDLRKLLAQAASANDNPANSHQPSSVIFYGPVTINVSGATTPDSCNKPGRAVREILSCLPPMGLNSQAPHETMINVVFNPPRWIRREIAAAERAEQAKKKGPT